jgi:hypothetical protein
MTNQLPTLPGVDMATLRKRIVDIIDSVITDNQRTGSGSGFYDTDRMADMAIKAITEAVRPALVAAASNELKAFEPLQRDHSKCIDAHTCIGYQNAASDFDNEKQIRLDQLNTQANSQEEMK